MSYSVIEVVVCHFQSLTHPPSLSPLSHSLTPPLSHSLTHSPPLSLPLSHSLTHPPSLSLSLTHSLPPSLSLSLTPPSISLTHSLPPLSHSLTPLYLSHSLTPPSLCIFCSIIHFMFIYAVYKDVTMRCFHQLVVLLANCVQINVRHSFNIPSQLYPIMHVHTIIFTVCYIICVDPEVPI